MLALFIRHNLSVEVLVVVSTKVHRSVLSSDPNFNMTHVLQADVKNSVSFHQLSFISIQVCRPSVLDTQTEDRTRINIISQLSISDSI